MYKGIKRKIPLSLVMLSICFTGLLFFQCKDLLIWNGDPNSPSNVLTERDSIAVRVILDTNGLSDVEVREVIQLQSSIVGGIRIDSMPITKFVFAKEFERFVNGFNINIIDCPIDTIIIRDSIHTNITIGIARTNLRSIPDNISLLSGNIYLYLGNNQIQHISPEIMKCNISFLDLYNNCLCQISDTLNNWIISKKPNSNNWRSTQKCNLHLISTHPKEYYVSPKK